MIKTAVMRSSVLAFAVVDFGLTFEDAPSRAERRNRNRILTNVYSHERAAIKAINPLKSYLPHFEGTTAKSGTRR
jgi:hypothetical protein